MDLTHLSQELADVPVSSIAAFAATLTVVRIALVRIPNAATRALSEILEAALIASVIVFMLVQPFILKSFYIPSGSMLPTLMDDDHIVCNKIQYRFAKPQHEDVVIFVAPQKAIDLSPDASTASSEPINYIKRLVGLPGDVIQTKHGYVTLVYSGHAYDETHNALRHAFNLDDPDNEHVKIEPNDVAVFDAVWKRYTADQLAQQFSMPGATVIFHPGQTIRNGKVLFEPYTAEDPAYDMKIVDGHSVTDDPDNGQDVDGVIPDSGQLLYMRQQPPGPVPAGCVFVMGDNRNDSNDSTRWGPLQINRLVGKAGFIFWPTNRIRAIY